MEGRKYFTLGRGFVFVSTGEEKWILSKLLKIRLDSGRPPEDLDCRQEERNQDQTQEVTHIADTSTWEHL